MLCCVSDSFMIFLIFCVFFFFKQKTAYEMRISDWSSDVCSSDLLRRQDGAARALQEANLWYEKQYRLPKFEETDRLLAEFSRSPVTQWLDKQGGIESNLAAALGAIHTPFLDVEGALSSVSAVAELQSIGQAIRSTTAFELGFVDSRSE